MLSHSWLRQWSRFRTCRAFLRALTTESEALHSKVVADVGAKAWNLHFKEGQVFTDDLAFANGVEDGMCLYLRKIGNVYP